jgi:branched-chain amino acid transport system permease protein
LSTVDLQTLGGGRRRFSLKVWLPVSILLGALLIAPVLGLSSFIQSLIIEIFVFSLLALSLNVLLGYTGLVSLGHAAFFAIGGYAIAIISVRWSTEIMLIAPLAVASAALWAVPIGWLSIRLSGFYFLMITLAFAQMISIAAVRWKSLTGGSDGILVPQPMLFGNPVLQDRQSIYYFTLVVFVASVLVVYLIVSSRFGRTLAGIRENSLRMRALGYNVGLYKLIAFVIAASVAGLAGAMNTVFNLFIDPGAADWTQSALVLVMVLIGGAGFFVGPIVGAAIVLILEHWLSSHTEHWGLVLGLLFIGLITFAREGLAGVAASALGVGDGGNR